MKIKPSVSSVQVSKRSNIFIWRLLECYILIFCFAGFSSEELEKPFFPDVSSCSAKVPLVLSSADEDTVIQVIYRIVISCYS